MDKPTLNLIGHKLRREFKPPDDLPYPMQMALKALANQPVRDGDSDNDIRREDTPQLVLGANEGDER